MKYIPIVYLYRSFKTLGYLGYLGFLGFLGYLGYLGFCKNLFAIIDKIEFLFKFIYEVFIDCFQFYL